jgi:hypothetical protein
MHSGPHTEQFINVQGARIMWSIQDVSAEELAKLFHHYRGALAHDFDCTGAEERTGESASVLSASESPSSLSSSSSSFSSSWDRTPAHERKLMVAAARLALLELATTPQQVENRPYFAKPGEADWGC